MDSVSTKAFGSNVILELCHLYMNITKLIMLIFQSFQISCLLIRCEHTLEKFYPFYYSAIVLFYLFQAYFKNLAY